MQSLSHLCLEEAIRSVFSCESRQENGGAGCHRKMANSKKKERHYSCSGFEMCCYESARGVGKATAPCSPSGLLRRIYLPPQATQPCLLPLGEQMHSSASAFQFNAKSAVCLIDKPSPIKTKSILLYHCTLIYHTRSFSSTPGDVGSSWNPGSMGGRDSTSDVSKIERSERLGSNPVRQTRPLTPARRTSNANRGCLYLK